MRGRRGIHHRRLFVCTECFGQGDERTEIRRLEGSYDRPAVGCSGKTEANWSDTSITSVSALEAFDQVLSGAVDVAVLPSNLVLAEETTLEVIPGLAISFMTNHFATIYLPEGLSYTKARIPSGPFPGLYSLIAEIILQEGYGYSVIRDRSGEAVVRCEGSGDKTQTVELTIGETSGIDRNFLDLGREWFELVNY